MSRMSFGKHFIGALGAAAATLGMPATAATQAPKPSAVVVNTTAHAAGATGRVALAPQTSTTALKRAQLLGPHVGSAAIGITFGLRLRNLDQLKTFLRDVQDPTSAVYHRYLTPAEFTAAYGPTRDQVDAVVRFLRQSGIAVKDVSSNRLLIHTHGSAAAYEHALGIRVNDYSLNGRSFFSTEDSPKLPAEIVGSVANVIGLNNAVQMQPHAHFQAMAPVPHAAAASAAPTTAPGAVTFVPPVSTSYYNPTQIQKAYGWPDITDTANGGGVTTAIITAESSGLATDPDFANFWSILGLPSHQVNIIPVDGDDGLTAGMGETLLDIEWSGVMSPGERLNVYVAADPSFASFTDAFNQFVSDNTAQVMSTSWGAPEIDNPVQTDDQIFMEAAAQGISMFAAAGDHGSSDGTSDSNMPDFPAVDLYVTAANGTELQIADVSGSYSSEAAWNGTGGAISRILSEPDWQTGPGVPANGWRNDSDVAMNAGGDFPYIFVYQGTWFFVFGTSAVAPQLAAMFADGVSASGGVRLGQSNSLIYNDVNAGNYASDFRDVTSGSNGAYSAGADWDHPTGWGSPIVSSLLSHITIAAPAGALAGTVTASGGQPIAGAKLVATPGNYSALTRTDGSYSFSLPAGSYSLTVSAFGYAAGSGSVGVSTGSTTTQDFTLNAAATAAVTGNVTDGGGHGYGLYAEITVTASAGNGQVADIWTDPKTGAYRLDLPQGYDYQVTVTPALVGYVGANTTLTALSGGLTQNFALAPDGSCTTPGYAAAFGENFDGANFPPGGWTITNGVSGSTVVWNTNDAWYDGNFSGGSGVAATADSNSAGEKGYTGPYDTSLVTPPIQVTGLPANPVLQFLLGYQEFGGEALDVDVSGDGGTTWTTLAHINTNQGSLYASGVTYQVPITLPPAASSILLRWRYYNLASGFDWYAQIDDVSIGQCGPVPGGLVMGALTESGTGHGLAGATVVDDVGDSATAFQNPADANLPAAYYILFAAAGSRSLTASAAAHSSTGAALSIADGDVDTQDFSLGAAHFVGNPGSVSMHAMVNNRTQQSLQVSNTGSGAGSYLLLSFDSSVAPQLQAAPTPVMRVPCPGASPLGIAARGKPLGGCSTPAGAAAAAGGQWTSLPPLPVATLDSAAAGDAVDGKIYMVGGVDTSGVPTAHAFVYEPANTAWRAIASMPMPLDDPVAAWINGKLYVTAGWTDASNSSAQLAIYDPATASWSTGAADPVPEGGGASAAVLGGKLYVVGGCPSVSSCGDTEAEVYDPAADSWSAPGTLAPYPHLVSWQGCGGIGGKLYCAGGTAGSQFLTEYPDGYVYDPAANGWTAIAPLPVQAGFSGPGGLWASAYSATAEGLLVSGGINHGDITNQGWMYSPADNNWTALPNTSDLAYRGAGACGFYRLGGSDGSSFVANVELLPGYGDCGAAAIPWLSLTPVSGPLAIGASGLVGLSVDGTGQQPYTSSQAYLLLSGDTPYAGQVIPVTVNWDPQPVDLAVSASAVPATTVQGGAPAYQVAYTVTLSNLQGSNHGPATQTMLTYTLPPGVNYVGASGPGACSLNGQTLSCSIGALALGASVTEVVTVDPGAAGALSGSFSVTQREPDSDGGNNSATVETTVLGVADVNVVSYSASPGSVTVGGDAKLNLSVGNAGPDAANGVTASIALPAGLSFESVTTSLGSCTGRGATVDCSIGTLPAHGVASVWVALKAETAGTVSATVTVATTGVDTVAGNNRGTASLTVTAPTPSGGGSGGSGGGGGGGGGGSLDAGVLALLAALYGRRRQRRRA